MRAEVIVFRSLPLREGEKKAKKNHQPRFSLPLSLPLSLSLSLSFSRMATLAENFLADLDELSEGEEEEQQQQQEDEKEEEEKGNGDDKVCLFSSSSVFDAAVALSLSLARSLPVLLAARSAQSRSYFRTRVWKNAHQSKTRS